MMRFDLGHGPAKVARDLEANYRTVLRYHADWKKLPPGLQIGYLSLKKLLRTSPGSADRFKNELATSLGITGQEVEAELLRPWGLKRLLLRIHARRRAREKEKMALARRMVDEADRAGISVSQLADDLNAFLLFRDYLANRRRRGSRGTGTASETDMERVP